LFKLILKGSIGVLVIGYLRILETTTTLLEGVKSEYILRSCLSCRI